MGKLQGLGLLGPGAGQRRRTASVVKLDDKIRQVEISRLEISDPESLKKIDDRRLEIERLLMLEDVSDEISQIKRLRTKMLDDMQRAMNSISKIYDSVTTIEYIHKRLRQDLEKSRGKTNN